MSRRPTHHPPLAGALHRPTHDQPGYIYGSSGLVGGFGCRDFYVATIPRPAAVDMVRANHYSHRVVNNSYVHLGIFLGGQLVGCLQFGYALNPHRASVVVAGTGTTQYLELNRMWVDDCAPRNSESRAIAYAVRYIKRALPQVRWLQSFADERCGRWGVVYQAANFLYVGSHWTEFYELDGEAYHSLLLTAHRKSGTRGPYLQANLHRATRRKLRQFRYVFFIQPKYRKDLRLRVQPYPKPGQEGEG